MEVTKEQKVLQQVINAAWENEAFKVELMANPIGAIERLIGEKLQLPEGKTLIVRDQTDENTIYINIPAEETSADDTELNEAQLETIAGGVYGNCIPDGHKPAQTKITEPTNPFKYFLNK